MESHHIAVISDTHGILRPEVVRQIEACEAVFHAGDMDNPEIYSRLKSICRTDAVAGNADADWAQSLPGELSVDLYGFRIYMMHNRKQIRQNLSDYDIVIYGHSHKYQEESQGRTRYLNPGSCGRKRFRLPLTMMILTLYPETHEFATERIELMPPPAAHSASSTGKAGQASLEQDMHKLVKLVMKEMDAGKPVADIASGKRADKILVEQICRMYATHPGVDVDGILDRLERRNL